MIDATLCFVVQEEPPKRLLMGLKKVRFGAGKVTGFGGKVNAGEAVLTAAARELEEEVGIRVAESDLQPVGLLTFLFPDQPDWSQTVHVFFTGTWAGEPTESVEMRPFWVESHDVPYYCMWQDGEYWLPKMLAGEKVRAVFTFCEDNETVESVEYLPWGAGA